MKSHVYLIIGLTLIMSACERAEQDAPPQAVESPSYEYDGILRHMHRHADQIDLLNNALANDDIDASKSPARWLHRHDTMIGVPVDWQPYLADLREAARVVESADDLAAAEAASLRIVEQCRDCHAAAGIVINDVDHAGD